MDVLSDRSDQVVINPNTQTYVHTHRGRKGKREKREEKKKKRGETK